MRCEVGAMYPSLPMPVICPVPLKTRGRPWWGRACAWLFAPRVWELVEEYRYSRPSGEVLVIPAGFRTDFASSPRAFWPLGMDPTGILLIPSLIHDWGYRHNWYFDGDGHRFLEGAGKGYHDRLLRQISAEVNEMFIPGVVAWLALDLFGWPAWINACNRRTGGVDLQGVYRD